MTEIRVSVKTGSGAFTLVPSTQVATVDGKNGIAYKFPDELEPGSRILIRKTGSEGLSLGDIVSTLWARSDQYRKDRLQVFEGDGASLPSTTKLSIMLDDLIKCCGGAKNGNEAAEFLRSYIPESSGYTVPAVRDWLNNRVMFPMDPMALLSIANGTNYTALARWTEEMISMDQMPVKRLRVLHSSIRSVLAKPKDAGMGESAGKESGAERKHIVHLSDYLELLRKAYGTGTLNEIVAPVTVLGVSQVELSCEGTGVSEHGGTDLVKKVVGFVTRDPGKMKEILLSYPGVTRGKELEDAMARKKELVLTAGVEGLIPLLKTMMNWLNELAAAKPQYAPIAAYIAKNDMAHFTSNPESYLYSLIMASGHVEEAKAIIRSGFDKTMESLDLMYTDRSARKEVERLADKSAYKIAAHSRRIPYIDYRMALAKKLLASSPIVMSVMTTEEAIDTFVRPHIIEFAKTYNDFSMANSNSWHRVRKIYEVDLHMLNKFMDGVQHTSLGNMCKEIARIDREVRMPFVYKYLQTCFDTINTHPPVARLNEAYGISNIHPFVDALKNRLDTYFTYPQLYRQAFQPA